MIIGLDHVAIAVPDLEKSIKRFAEDFGLDFKGSEAVEPAKTQTAFFPISGTQIELVHPLNGEGPVQTYLDKKGGGLHHICFKSDDVQADMTRLTEKGYIFLSDAPKPGAHNTKVAFIHPKCTDGVLIEIAEHPKAD
ncbi:methylmalonyl-CoA epimerase [Gammaproteobacteria bacterium 42_54_T18]|nr:methylmalonyl-CoA epimerase [Gammaproteobacteria bacterium 42_54_T18]